MKKLTLLCCLAAVGCNGVLGLDERTYQEPAGAAGTGGSSAGTAGVSGAAGTAGNGGAAGSSGSAGTSGSGGTNGSAGNGGTAGTSGTSGTGGSAGSGGVAGVGGAAGSSGTGGTGGTACDPMQCPGVDTVCQTRICTNGSCDVSFTAASAVIADTTPSGDCQKSACDGNGNITTVADTSDIGSDNETCTTDSCTAAGAPEYTPVSLNTSCAEGTNGHYCSAAGTCVECNDASQCPTAGVCQTATCTGGACGVMNLPSNTVIADATPSGDCKKSACDGSGNVTTAVNPSDVQNDNESCTTDTCSVAGVPLHTPVTLSTPCSEGSGHFCSAAGTCVECNDASQCTQPLTECQSARTCTNQVCGATAKPDGTTCSIGTCKAEVCVQPSCDALPSNCGVLGNDDCCSTATTIVGGEVFYRDWDASNTTYTAKQYPATVSSFRLDKYEVTVGRFRAFVTAYDAWRAANHPAAGEGGDPNVTSATTSWNATWTANLPASAAVFKDTAHLSCDSTFHTWVEPATPGAAGSETKAINCVHWYEAAAFCMWDGGWLPTEAEWMYAAAGGSQNRAFPWSSPPASLTIDATYANYNNNLALVTSVGIYDPGKGRWGHEDLGGNVWEWNWDVFNNTYPGTAGATCENCASTTNTTLRVIRGGGFDNPAAFHRTASRNNFIPTNRNRFIGFRCARPAP